MNRNEVRRLAPMLGLSVSELTHYLKTAKIKITNAAPQAHIAELRVAVEFGYRCREKGMSLEATLWESGYVSAQ